MTRLEKLEEEVNQLTFEVENWRRAAVYDATMEGPKFKYWNRSQLDSCRRLYIEGIK